MIASLVQDFGEHTGFHPEFDLSGTPSSFRPSRTNPFPHRAGKPDEYPETCPGGQADTGDAGLFTRSHPSGVSDDGQSLPTLHLRSLDMD